MDFLESAITLIPALIGIDITIYDGKPDILTWFERKYCFSRQVQRIYSASELEAFLNSCATDLIYDVAEALGSHLIVFHAKRQWVLMGPFVEEGWSEISARVLLNKAGASETTVAPYKAYRCNLPIAQRDHALNIAQLVVEHTDGNPHREAKTIYAHAGDGTALAYPHDYENSTRVNLRYAIENRFVAAISQGDWEAVRISLEESKGIFVDIRFMSDDFRDHLVEAAILRTLIRVGAEWAGLSPVLIDSISQEYAQRMRYAVSNGKIDHLVVQMAKRFCEEVQELRRSNHSMCIKLAMDYMRANLNRQLTVAEIAKAAGVNREQFTKAFGQETGMTVKRYLAVQRCDIAAKLLESSRISVQEIAAYVGYLDSNYFSRVFKDIRGIAPHDYRKTHGPAIPLE